MRCMHNLSPIEMSLDATNTSQDAPHAQPSASRGKTGWAVPNPGNARFRTSSYQLHPYNILHVCITRAAAEKGFLQLQRLPEWQRGLFRQVGGRLQPRVYPARPNTWNTCAHA